MAAGLPKKLSNPLGWGIRLARWEGDPLVVDTAGFNDKTWLGLMGHPHSGALRITKRYRRRNFGHRGVEMTFDGARMDTKPFVIRFTEELEADPDILETFCNENEKDRAHSVHK